MGSPVVRHRDAQSGSDMESNAGWDDLYTASANLAVSTAKLHILQLEPIREKLGDRWGRLSDLVHKLFEKTLKHAQGQGDHFIQSGELSYIVTFRELAPEEAGLVCAAVAREVCKLLFGDGVQDISVRSLVGVVPEPSVELPSGWLGVSALLEWRGKETIIRPDDRPAQAATPTSWGVTRPRFLTQQDIALMPMWDLQSHKSSSVFLAPRTSLTKRGANTVRRFLGSAGEGEIIEAEIALLKAAANFARRVQEAQQVCAVGTSVSYRTLSSFNARIRYIGALKSVPSATPFLLKIEKIPEGTPLSRLAELIAMLRAPHLRILAEFDGTVPDLDVRLGAHGIGASLPDNCSLDKACEVLQSLRRRAMPQKKFAFVTGLASGALAQAASQHHVRFGLGCALGGGVQLADMNDVPQFPLH